MNAGQVFLQPAGAGTLTAQRWLDGRLQTVDEVVSEEVPVAFVYNGITHAVMLATPNDLEDFALGFALSERIVRQARDVYDIDVARHGDGIAIELRIASGAMARLQRTRQARTGRTGCGLCGVDTLQRFADDCADLPEVTAPPMRIAPAALHRAMAELAARQHLHHATGGVHAAGWAGSDGAIRLVREDVGRHNALDKLVGALQHSGSACSDGFAVVTSRASYEMVQKAAQAGIAVLAAVSAPTAMAVRMADRAGVTLAGFVRDGRHVLYAHPQRVAATA
ncbi:formate dehydrogenase accessory sulfurtransferase FdhD [Pseudoduganella plicata]|uniref:Sulfur carrier protein FdhD n=1 Tax=Pseudoduganella plicata TaxID=321984 RepID=A0A4V1ATC3_9BURK|nr:formate dehydrogenase accessory sulfurtransferase FdhD [Pseudoduganella plicata]QBQ35168.1 formate dehydrogenase accessory sulfurtransferase FdhD [Pseudoduganella plicata]GGZ05313.1 sulfurtransferase FdhD [Pseudoduganella plicata]